MQVPRVALPTIVTTQPVTTNPFASLHVRFNYGHKVANLQINGTCPPLAPSLQRRDAASECGCPQHPQVKGHHFNNAFTSATTVNNVSSSTALPRKVVTKAISGHFCSIHLG
uniref:Uncharacterized protein n=1 Tax=Trichuris muris TaxID=70415 RepID=A0A5S6Q5M1_TRIMR